jgi:hypothetical protein
MFILCQLYKSSFIDFIGGGSKGGMQSISPLNQPNGFLPLRITALQVPEPY